MKVLGIISSDKTLNKLINQTYELWEKKSYKPVFITSEDEIYEFINYELPEIVVINFSDPNIPLESLIERLEDDAWLHYFGIIGLYNQDDVDEDILLERLKKINVLTLLNDFRIRSHLMKSIEIIRDNYQIIFQRGFASKIMESSSGSFTIPNDIFAVPIYAGIAATSLAQSGKINPDKKMHLQLALAELIVNGIEHGNCEVNYDEKTEFMENGGSVVELVAEKCRNRKTARKKVHFDWETRNDLTKYVIRDEGPGFDVEGLNKILRTQDDFALHGRGIRMARNLSRELYYNNEGNQVTIIIEHEEQDLQPFPIRFRKEEILEVERNDIIVREGEASDYLYYIASGKYYVYHRRKRVGELNQNDIFMGEMAFLLSNKRNGTIKAADKGKLIKISRKAFVTLVRDYPYYGIFLSRLLARRLARSNEQNAQLTERVRRLETT
ncbi:MAG TPA: cyclic nucleotide-binding protein [Spirochaeta sp.]|nr:cyclic nucleotide-binding protein [Spirochaeta sp.]